MAIGNGLACNKINRSLYKYLCAIKYINASTIKRLKMFVAYSSLLYYIGQ